MKRLAWFTPLPSAPRGLPCRRSQLVTCLSEQFAIDLFVDSEPPAAFENSTVFNAYDFVWTHLRTPYDLAVYEIADSPSYRYVWPYLIRHPGLVLLHDDRLHESRASGIRSRGDGDAYRAEFHYDHPDANPDITALGVAGLLGLMTDIWPMAIIGTQ